MSDRASRTFRLPNGIPLLKSLQLNAERLQSQMRIAIPIPTLQGILSVAVAALPFDEEFYSETYPDIADAHQSGQITDLHMHFVQSGYFEGRLGAKPNFDAEFYRARYEDVTQAIKNGEFVSEWDHYIKAGAAEGRLANQTETQIWEHWLQLLKRD